MSKLCSAPHPTLSGVRCDRVLSHRRDHRKINEDRTETTWPRGARGGARNVETSSLVMTALAAGATFEAAGAAAGVTKQRAAAIAAAAGGRPETTAAALLARVRELAAAAGEEPGDYLEDAAEALRTVEAIAERINTAIKRGLHLPAHPLVDELFRIAIGHNPPELAAQVRAAVEAASTEEP